MIRRKRIKLIKILNLIAKGKKPPFLIKYDKMEDGYKKLMWDENKEEYVFFKHPSEIFIFTPHHNKDKVEVIRWW